MKNGIAMQGDLCREYFVLQINSRTVSVHRGYEDAMRAGLLEPISKSFEEDNEAGELDKSEEVRGMILPANENAALPLDPGKEALD